MKKKVIFMLVIFIFSPHILYAATITWHAMYLENDKKAWPGGDEDQKVRIWSGFDGISQNDVDESTYHLVVSPHPHDSSLDLNIPLEWDPSDGPVAYHVLRYDEWTDPSKTLNTWYDLFENPYDLELWKTDGLSPEDTIAWDHPDGSVFDMDYAIPTVGPGRTVSWNSVDGANKYRLRIFENVGTDEAPWKGSKLYQNGGEDFLSATLPPLDPDDYIIEVFASTYNDYGGNSELSSRSRYNILYTEAVPIPGAVWLFGSGLIGLITIRRKYK